jgi:hypothetical protein
MLIFIVRWFTRLSKRYDQALAELEKCRNLGSTSDADPEIARIYALQGRQTEALRILDPLIARHKARTVSAYNIALVYAAMGDNGARFSMAAKFIRGT